MKQCRSALAILLVFAMVITLLPTFALAADVVESGTWGDNLTWTLDENGLLTISGEGEMAGFDNDPDAAWRAFSDQINEVVIEEGVTTVGNGAFYACGNLTAITLPASLTYIHEAGMDCPILTDIHFNGTSDQWYAIGRGPGNERIDQAMIWYPNDPPVSPEPEVPPTEPVDPEPEEPTDPSIIESGMCGDGVQWMVRDYGKLCIGGEGEMTAPVPAASIDVWRIDIEYGVTAIADDAFCNYQNVNSVTIPETVTRIGARAFSCCGSQTQVEYNGTMEQWDAIAIGEGNELLQTARIPCADGVINAPTVTGEIEFLSEAPEGATVITKSYPATRVGLAEMLYDAANGSISNYSPWFTDLDGLTQHQIEAICWVKERGIMSGLSHDIFGPGNSMTRAEIATLFYRLMGSPDVSGMPNPYSDLEKSSWYFNCVVWSASQDQVQFRLNDPNRFEPDNSVESLAAVLYADPANGDQVLGVQSVLVDDPEPGGGLYPGIADSGMCGEQVHWSLTRDNRLLISGTGDMTAVPSAESTDVLQIQVGDGVTGIADDAFCNYKNLARVTIPGTVTHIGDRAFSGCDSLTRVDYNGTTEQWDAITIGTGNEVLLTARIYCYDSNPDTPTVTGEVRFLSEAPEGATVITKSYSVTRVGLAEMLYEAANGSISNYSPVFSDLGGLTQHQIEAICWVKERGIMMGTSEDTFSPGSSVTRAQLATMFYRMMGCPDVSGLSNPYSDLDEYSWYFDSVVWSASQDQVQFRLNDPNRFEPDNSARSLAAVLYADPANGDQVLGVQSVRVDDPADRLPEPCGANTRWLLDGNGTLTISGTGEVTENPWRNNWGTFQSIRSVVVEEGVTSICGWAFEGCSGLTRLTLPASLATIGYGAFQNCGSPKQIYYAGTKAQWGEVRIESENGWLGNAVIHCADGDLSPSGQCGDNVFWSLDENGVLTISGTGVMTSEPLGWSMNSEVRSIVISEGITGLADYVLGNYPGVTSVTIPATLEQLGNGVLVNCDSLTAIDVAPGNPSYASVDGVLFSKDMTRLLLCPAGRGGDYTIPDGVTTVAYDAFYNCRMLARLTFPASLTQVEYYAFANCFGLADVYYPGTMEQWGALEIGAGNDSLNLAVIHCTDGDIMPFGKCGDNTSWTLDENGVLTIGGTGETNRCPWGSNAELQSKIRSVVISNGITGISESTFSGCKNLTSVTLPASLTTIGRYAFSATGLTSVTIPGSVTYIGDNAFSGCTSLTSLTIPDSVLNVGRDVLSGTPIYDDPANWTDGVFYYGKILVKTNEDFASCTSYTIRPGTKAIAADAFQYNPNLQSVTIPDSLVYIGDDAFYNCSGLTSVTIPDSLVYIGEGAFYNCSGLTSVTIPKSVKHIGRGAFNSCSSLKSISIPAGIESVGSNLLTNTPMYNDPDNWTDGVFYYDSILLTVKYDVTACTIRPGTRLIADGVFSGSSLTSVVIPEGITRIPDGAFSWCWSLRSVTFPASLESIGQGAFADSNPREICSNGTTAQWRAVRIESGNDVLQALFVRCADGTLNASGQCGEHVFWELNEDGVMTISGTGEMTSDPNLNYELRNTVKAVVIEPGITSIGQYAFGSYEKLSSITIPESVASIVNGAFWTRTTETTDVYYGGTMAQWREIPVEAGCDLIFDFIHCTDGDIEPAGQCGDDVWWSLDRDGKLTIRGTGAIWDKVAEDTNFGLERLSVFSCQPRIRSVVIEPGVTRIGNAAFYGCYGIRSVTIPASVTSIGDFAFLFYLESETLDVNYAGTEARWNTVEIGETGNDPLRNANINFGDEPGPLVITSQPQDASGAVGTTVKFAVGALGEGLTYQWQYQRKGSVYWFDSTFAGADTSVISVPVTALRDGQSYRCVITDASGASLTSDAATLTVIAPIQITVQPQDVSGAVGTTVRMTVAAQGEGLTYQWQYQRKGSTYWHDSTFEGADTSAISIPVTALRDGQSYRCVIKDENGNKATSNAATLTIPAPPQITAQPQDVSGAVGTTVSMTVAAQGEGLTYRWQYQRKGSAYWFDSTFAGADTTTISIPVTALRDGQSYRCVITDQYGAKTISDASVLTVQP